MLKLDWHLIEMLVTGLFVAYAIFRSFKSLNVTMYKIKGKPEIIKIDNADDVIKELDNIKEQISQPGNSEVRVTVRRLSQPLLGGTESAETEINNPDEEMKIINDIEDSLKKGMPLTPNTKITVRTNLRKTFQTNFGKKP